MPKYDDWTVLSRYNHVKGLGSRMTKKRSDPNRNLYKISYNYSMLEIAIYFQDPTKPNGGIQWGMKKAKKMMTKK